MKKLFISICLLLFACNAFAADWYVRPSGGSYGLENGTSYANAWDGLSKVAWGSGGIVAGDTLYVCDSFTGETLWIVSRNGTNENYITIRGDYPSHAGVINGGSYCIALQDSDYIEIKNITLHSASSTALDSTNVPHSHYTIVDNVTVYDTTRGIALQGISPIIRNCEVYDFDTTGIIQYDSTPDGNVQIYGNTVHDFGIVNVDGDGIMINDSGECYNNLVYNSIGSEGGTCGIDSSSPKSGNIIYIHHNIVHDCADRGIGAGDETGVNTFYVEFNLLYDNYDGIYCRTKGTFYIRNNTITGTGRRGVSMKETGVRTVIMNNNIISGSLSFGVLYTSSGSTLNSNYNLIYGSVVADAYYNGSNITFAQWQALGFDANSLNEDPGFASSTDFRISSESPAIDNGTNTAVDIFDTDLDGNPAIN